MFKTIFIIILTLYYFDPLKEIFVKINALDYVFSSIFSQKDKYNILYLVIFISKKYNPTEYKYKIYNKKLFVIVRYFKG
jgi:RNase H-like domain found in reverse transcriptase